MPTDLKPMCPACDSHEWFPGAACFHCGWEGSVAEAYSRMRRRAAKAERAIADIRDAFGKPGDNQGDLCNAVRWVGAVNEVQKRRIAELEAETRAIDAKMAARIAGRKEPMSDDDMAEAHRWLDRHAPGNVREYLTGWQIGIRSKNQRIATFEGEVREYRKRIAELEAELDDALGIKAAWVERIAELEAIVSGKTMHDAYAEGRRKALEEAVDAVSDIGRPLPEGAQRNISVDCLRAVHKLIAESEV